MHGGETYQSACTTPSHHCKSHRAGRWKPVRPQIQYHRWRYTHCQGVQGLGSQSYHCWAALGCPYTLRVGSTTKVPHHASWSELVNTQTVWCMAATLVLPIDGEHGASCHQLGIMCSGNHMPSLSTNGPPPCATHRSICIPLSHHCRSRLAGRWQRVRPSIQYHRWRYTHVRGPGRGVLGWCS
jgi:hypothetical protein